MTSYPEYNGLAQEEHQIYESVGDTYGLVKYIRHMGDDKAVVDAARVSHSKDAEKWRKLKDPKLIRFLLKHGHTSPFEHCVVTFLFRVPLFVRSQHHRHRTWAYNEVSRRYTDEDIRFYLPKTFRPQAKSNRQASDRVGILPRLVDLPSPLGWLSDLTVAKALESWSYAAEALYNRMLKAGVSREMARMVLPQNLYTRYYGTVNLHNALKFIQSRKDHDAQWEIQQAALAMEEILTDLYPEVMKAWQELHTPAEDES